MASIEDAVNIDDLRVIAKRRLPRICYDFIEGGVEDEVGVQRNRSSTYGPGAETPTAAATAITLNKRA